jgi:hypothetical protein
MMNSSNRETACPFIDICSVLKAIYFTYAGILSLFLKVIIRTSFFRSAALEAVGCGFKEHQAPSWVRSAGRYHTLNSIQNR